MVLLFKKREFRIPKSGIDSVERIKLGGVDHSVLIQAENPENPILLFVHGGPCMPVPGVVSRGQDYVVSTTTRDLVKHFVVVFYDQRGAGKSFHKNIPAETMRVEQFISDCNELVDLLRIRFKKEKIYLAAHSWGSIIGLTMASRFPEKLHGYIGISQILNWTNNDKLCYEWVKNRALEAKDQKTLTKLNELGEPPYLQKKKWIDFRRPLIKYNSMVYQSETIKHPGMLGGMKQFFTSTEYSLKDIIHTFYSAYNLTYTQKLVEDFSTINLDVIKRIDTRIAFLHGEKDVHVDGRPVQEFFKTLEAPLGKDLVWYENSSHMFYPDEARMIEKYIIKFSSHSI